MRRSSTGRAWARSTTTIRSPRSRSTTSRSRRATAARWWPTSRSRSARSAGGPCRSTTRRRTAPRRRRATTSAPAEPSSSLAGETTKTVTVTVNGDTLDEANESYIVNLSNPSNAAVTDGQGLGTITDDDAMPALVIDDVSVTEGDTGTTNASFTVSLSSPSGQTVTANFATANGTATAPADYAAAAGTVTFTAASDEDDHGRGQQRHDRRGQRDLLRQPLERDERDDRGQPGRRHDHRRRRPADALDQRRRRSPKATRAR